MVLCVSAQADDLDETVSTLRFGARARGVVNTLAPARRLEELDQHAHAALVAAEGARDGARAELAALVRARAQHALVARAVAAAAIALMGGLLALTPTTAVGVSAAVCASS